MDEIETDVAACLPLIAIVLGEYKEELRGLDFILQEKGLSPHPNIARWIEDRVQEALKQLNADDIS